MLEVQWATSNPFSYNYGMDLKWVHSIFVASMYELDQTTKMQIERVRVRLQCPMY